jgi:anti-anti-sigma factor
MTAERHHPTRAVTFSLPERLDALTADGVYMEIHRIWKGGSHRLILDAGAMAYISSRGIRALLRMRKDVRRDGGVLVLENLRAFAREVLTASGLGDDLEGLVADDGMVCR